MKNQDTSYTQPPTAVQNIVTSRVALGDSYIVYETDDNEYMALIKKAFSNKATQLKIYRQGTNQANNWVIEESSTTDLSYSVSNQYYVFSNIGYGQSLNLPIHETMTSYGITIICCLSVLLLVFKGVFLRCRKK